MALFGKRKDEENGEGPVEGLDALYSATAEAAAETDVVDGYADGDEVGEEPETQQAKELNMDRLDDDLLDLFSDDEGVNADLSLLTEQLPDVSMEEVLGRARDVRALVRRRSLR